VVVVLKYYSTVNEKYVLVGIYFYLYVSHLLDFNIIYVVLFDIKYFFLMWIECMCDLS